MASYAFYRDQLALFASNLEHTAKELQVLADDSNEENTGKSKFDRWWDYEKKIERLEKDLENIREVSQSIQDYCEDDD